MLRRALLVPTLVLTLAAAAARPAHGGAMLVPAKTQAAILKKILVYDKALQGKTNVRFFLVGSEKNPGAAEEITAALREVGLTVGSARIDELAAKLDDAAVVYVVSGVASASLKRLCVEKKVLSVSGFPGLAESGDVSVAIGLREDGKPQIVVHLAQTKAEGHEFSAELLKLAKVVR